MSLTEVTPDQLPKAVVQERYERLVESSTRLSLEREPPTEARLMADRLMTLSEGRKHAPERAAIEAAASTGGSMLPPVTCAP